MDLNKLRIFSVNLIDADQGCCFTFMGVAEDLKEVKSGALETAKSKDCPNGHKTHAWQIGGVCSLSLNDVMQEVKKATEPEKPKKETPQTTKSAFMQLLIDRKDVRLLKKAKALFSDDEYSYIWDTIKAK